jgi:hypothetical protein
LRNKTPSPQNRQPNEFVRPDLPPEASRGVFLTSNILFLTSIQGLRYNRFAMSGFKPKFSRTKKKEEQWPK